MKNSLIDVCFLTAGKIDLFQKAVETTLRETEGLDCKYYALDNGSDKRQQYVDFLKQYPQIQLERANQNVGFPRGANKVMRRGTSPLILFVSDDIEWKEGAIQSLVKTMDDPSTGICGVKLLFPEQGGKNRPAGKVQHVGHSVNIRGNIFHIFVGWDANNPKCCQSGEVFSVTGATFMVRRKLFERARGFDEIFGKGTYEDVDLCIKIRELGSKVWVDTNSVAYHHVGATADYLKQPFPLNENRQIFMDKHRGKLVWDEYIRW